MKGILEFDIPEDQEDFKLAQDGHKYKRVVDDMYQWLRNKAKYEDKKTVTIEEAREKLSELLNEYVSD